MGQLQVLRGKVQEAKPVFAVVEPATVPLAPASPKKMLIIIAFAFLAFVFESAWILFGKDIYHDFKNELKRKINSTILYETKSYSILCYTVR